MGSGLGIFLMFLTLLGGGPNGPSDLLDLVPTQTYWKSKAIEPTVAQLEKDAKAETPKGSIDPDKLISLLGSDDFKAREGAAKELEAMGAAMLPKLRAATESKDAELASGATAL